MSSLKGRKLGICHHRAADNANDFAFLDRLTRKHPIAADARLSKFNSRINPGLWKIVFHLYLFLLPLWLIER